MTRQRYRKLYNRPKEYGIIFILAHVSLYILYNNVYKKYFVISLKKFLECFAILWKVPTFAPANEKQRSLRASSLKDFT